MDKIQEVDLNLRHYIGERFDVIKDIKVKISNYLRNPSVSEFDRSIYSAIYNALTYYQNISDISISGESESKTFLENTLKDFNNDLAYLSEKYNSADPKAPRVIEVKGRIKSPVSAMDKILEKVAEYVKEGRDLTRLNESLRDFIGLRFIINPPPEIKAQGKEAESEFCYQIFDDLMKRKGIGRQIAESTPEDTDYEFIPVNTTHDPHKLQKIINRPTEKGYAFDPEEEGVFIPSHRPESVERYGEYFKDYRMYPKYKLYQRIHICTRPYYSKFIPEETIPKFIIPSKAKEPAIEYQMCLKNEEEFAEHGKAAHVEYKDRSFHRLAIPLILFDDDTLRKVRLGRLDESMEQFYGYSFRAMFNIDYQTFLRIFDRQQRDEIIAGRLQIDFNEETNEYLLQPSKKVIITESPEFLQTLLRSATPEELKRFYEANNIFDGSIYPSGDTRTAQKKTPLKIKVYKKEDMTQVKDPKKQKHSIYKTFKRVFVGPALKSVENSMQGNPKQKDPRLLDSTETSSQNISYPDEQEL